ncbi:MBL fold metallo-hydrolase [Rhodoplanes elegans]|uniref:MBL fold metallo-hydrolase n=1 Tax=Rhodoplanes elegans TaxID=29408 RepID=A0A327KCS4_9BRAD|nr:MBL fold metallo-hydrolase [Rhodoplanes elegans]MBK5958452.1 MBL fold metallo-hydrolase [Rhodoplanes elegans]RAI35122.1 MBL fold metallo-hydrolase [Rhodoplanes elegans]
MSEQKPEVSRRTFAGGVAAGTLAGAVGTMGVYSYSPWRQRHFVKAEPTRRQIGEVKSVKVTNISETSWFDNRTLMSDIRGAGGLLVNQYTYNWAPFTDVKGKLGKGSYEQGVRNIQPYLAKANLEDAWAFQMENAVNPLNSGGFSALIEVETLEGETKRILLDSGWSFDWIDKSFQREGIDKMLAENKIDIFIVSHEHFDHFWGVPVVFKYAPTIKTYYPKGFYAEGLDYFNVAGHRGERIETQPGLTVLFPGAALYNFQTPIICRVFGEQSLFFNVKDRGLVTITGCCHQGILQFASVAQRAVEAKKLYGLYGGLHVSPFEEWDPKYDDLVAVFKKWGFEKVACNHCTGILTARKLQEAGIGIVSGTARYRSKDTAYLGNGDQVTFAMNDDDKPAVLVPGGSASAAPAQAGGGVKY